VKHGQSFKTMAITINGTGTLTGVSVGGLPDGIVDTDMLAANAVSSAKIADDAVATAKIADDAVTAAKRGAGSILQIVNFRKTDTFSSSANGFVDIGVGVNITPSATSSKILIIVSISGFVHSGSGGAAKIVRTISGTATDLGKADASGNRHVSSFTGSLYTGDGTSSDLLQLNANTQFLDSPNTTSQINYKVQCHPENNTMRINYQENSDNSQASGVMTTSYITCMEVAG